MNKEFCPYSICLKLKELGFDEECFGWYSYEQENTLVIQNCKTYLGIENCTKAPLWQQAFDWLREKYGINTHITVYSLTSNTYGFELMSIDYQTISTLRTGFNSEHFHGEIIEYKSYEEAREQAILKCIELIFKYN